MLKNFLLSVLKTPQDLIDTDVRPRKKELHIIALKRMGKAVIMLLLHRLLRKAVMFCAFKKIQELMTAKKRIQEEL